MNTQATLAPVNMDPKLLDVTMAGKLAVRREQMYQDAYPQTMVPLKAKYRIQRGAHKQWGTGGDQTGKARIQGKAQNQIQRNRVMVVDALSGHKVMEDQ